MTHKLMLTVKQVLGFVIMGLKNGKVAEALSLAQEYYDQLPDDTPNDVVDTVSKVIEDANKD